MIYVSKNEKWGMIDKVSYKIADPLLLDEIIVYKGDYQWLVIKDGNYGLLKLTKNEDPIITRSHPYEWEFIKEKMEGEY